MVASSYSTEQTVDWSAERVKTKTITKSQEASIEGKEIECVLDTELSVWLRVWLWDPCMHNFRGMESVRATLRLYTWPQGLAAAMFGMSST